MRDYADTAAELRARASIVTDSYDVDPYNAEKTAMLMEDAADAIEELLAAVPKWISVENPPDNDRNIFICHGSADFKAPCIGHYEPDMKRFYEDKNWFASPIYDAMFWCEMPKLPLPNALKENT